MKEGGVRMSLHESGENYLETILLLQRRNGFVRAVDVANELGYTKASISRAMRILRENGYILIAHSGQITLTEAGMDKACDIYERHCVITQFLMQTLQLDMDAADADAMERELQPAVPSCQRIGRVLSYEGGARIRLV